MAKARPRRNRHHQILGSARKLPAQARWHASLVKEKKTTKRIQKQSAQPLSGLQCISDGSGHFPFLCFPTSVWVCSRSTLRKSPDTLELMIWRMQCCVASITYLSIVCLSNTRYVPNIRNQTVSIVSSKTNTFFLKPARQIYDLHNLYSSVPKMHVSSKIEVKLG